MFHTSALLLLFSGRYIVVIVCLFVCNITYKLYYIKRKRLYFVIIIITYLKYFECKCGNVSDAETCKIYNAFTTVLKKDVFIT